MEEYISKEEIIDECRQYANHENNVKFKPDVSKDRKHDSEVAMFMCEHFRKFVKELPSADVRPNIHGHWEEDSKEGFHHCSKCGQIIFSCQKWFKCCPKCMAVMDEKPFKNCHKTKCEACIYHGHCDREDMREPKGEKGETHGKYK